MINSRLAVIFGESGNKFQEKFEDEDDFFDALRAAGGSNSDKLIKLAEEIGKDELIGIVLDYDHSLKWAINEILN